MKMEYEENDILYAEEDIFSHDLNLKEIEQNKQNFTELTSIRINFEPEELNINSGINTKIINEKKTIKDLFKNHVRNIYIINRGSL